MQPTIDRHAAPPKLGEYNGFEIYPMPFFVTLTTRDPLALCAWYEAALGFGVMLRGPLVHLRRRKYQDVLIAPGEPTVGGPSLRLDADGEIDALAQQARSIAQRGASAVEGPTDTPWNTRELHVTDPDGYRLVFSARRATPDAQIEARVQAMFEAGRKDR